MTIFLAMTTLLEMTSKRTFEQDNLRSQKGNICKVLANIENYMKTRFKDENEAEFSRFWPYNINF
jgi:hypothetical protein